MDIQVYSPEEIAEFTDSQYAFEDDAYTGIDDDDVDFGGENLDFASELGALRSFTVVVNNDGNQSERISFGAAMAPVQGTTQLSEGVVALPGGRQTTTCVGTPTSYDFFKNFIKQNPSRLVAMKVTSSKESQLAQSLIVTHVSPFETLGSKPMSFQSFTNERNYNAKMLTLKNLNMQLDNQTDIAVDIPAKTETVFTLYVGGIYNIAKGLNSRSNRSKKSARVQASRV